jgi:hypothetical protein
MEDKLREYRFLKQSSSEQKVVLLGQLDGVRRELLEVLACSAPRIMFAKEIVREVLNFASAGDDTPRSGASPSQASSRLPSSREKSGRDNRNAAPVAESSLFSLMSGSPKPSLPSGQTSYGSLHENDLWDGSNQHTRHHMGSRKHVAGSNGNDDIAMPVPGATTTTASRSRSNHSTRSTTTTNAHQQHESMKDRSKRYGSSCTLTMSHHHITDEDIYGPAPIIGGGGGGSKNTATKTSSPGGTVSASLPTRGNCGRTGDAITTTSTGSGANRSSDGHTPGGMLKIREMLSRAEKGLSAVAETKEQRRAFPRILGGENNGNDLGGNGTEDWDGISPTGYNTPPLEFENSEQVTIDGARPWIPLGGAGARNHPGHSPAAASDKSNSYSVHEWTIKAEPNSASQFTPQSTTVGGPSIEGGDASSALGGSGSGSTGLPGLVGKLAGFAFVLGSIAAATMAATGTLPGSHTKNDGNNSGTHRQRNRETPRSSSQRQGTTSSRGRRASSGQGTADLPPWKDGNGNASTYASSGGAGARRKASSGRTRKSIGTTTNINRGGSTSQQGPVMHVHQPPSSGSFPAVTPPDVTAAMG